MGQQKNRGIIGILTGGGDVPGLNPAIRAVTIRALREGYKVIGIKRGWGGLIDIVRDPQYDNSGNFFELTEEIVNKAGRTGGTFLHTSRTRASHVPKANVPKHLQDKYSDDINDLTPEVLKNLAKPPRKAKEEPRKAGTRILAHTWKNSVPKPAKNRVVWMFRGRP